MTTSIPQDQTNSHRLRRLARVQTRPRNRVLRNAGPTLRRPGPNRPARPLALSSPPRPPVAAKRARFSAC
jgi:hypothetical protein